jgi:2-phosphosulfolactate phosphatase
MSTVEVVLSPLFLENNKVFTKSPFNIVVIDVLRATTSICTAFMNGAKEIIPLQKEEDSYEYKNRGYLLAAEKDGIKLLHADLGNSADEFTVEKIKNKSIAYLTTNGTKTILKAHSLAPVFLGSFLNLKMLSDYLIKDNKPIVIVSSGWKDFPNIEDTVCAGAFAQYLLLNGYKCIEDSANMSLDLWEIARNNLESYIKKASHYKRLHDKLNLSYIVPYSLQLNIANVVPYYDGQKIIDLFGL